MSDACVVCVDVDAALGWVGDDVDLGHEYLSEERQGARFSAEHSCVCLTVPSNTLQLITSAVRHSTVCRDSTAQHCFAKVCRTLLEM